jgi:hypothetical protein
MPRAAPAGAHPAARLIFLPPAASVDGRENGAFVKTRPGSRYVGGPVGLAKIYCQNGGDRNSGRFLGQKIDPLASRHRKVAQAKRPEYFELPRSQPGQDLTLLTALSSQPKTLRWAESGVRLTERGELLGADAGSHSNRLQFQRRC